MNKKEKAIKDMGVRFGPNDYLSVNYKIEVNCSQNAERIKKVFENCIYEVHRIWEEDQKENKRTCEHQK